MQHFKQFISTFVWACSSLLITLVILLGITYVYMEFQLPDVNILNDAHLQVPLRIYTADGQLIAQYGAKRRIPVQLSQIPPLMVHAVLATEDARYYSHPGVDFVGMIRAIKAVISTGRKVQGASTITMQVARNFFLTSKKTYSRKLNEVLLALKIDKEFSKDKILELYLNKVYFGNRAYGVAAAADVYYGKQLNQLTLAEMAMLAGLPQSPSRHNPLANPKAAIIRRNHVLARMLEVGFITKQMYLEAIKAPNTAKFHGQNVSVNAPYVAEMARQLVVAEYGDDAYDKGLKVYTTITARAQQNANAALANGLIAFSQRHGYTPTGLNLGVPALNHIESWEAALQKIATVDSMQVAAVLSVQQRSVVALLSTGQQIMIPWSGLSWARPAYRSGYAGASPTSADQIVKAGDVIWVRSVNGYRSLTEIPRVQGAIVSLNPENGALIALSGGFDYGFSNFNRATEALRQPGSNFKPFIYSAALDKGYTLASLVNDAPIVIEDSGENQLWRPSNDTQKFYGPTRLRVGLAKSRNLVSIRLLQDIGISYALEFISRFGFNPANMPNTLSLALGTASVTPMQMAAGFAVFANGGYRVTPNFIDKIVSQDNKVLYQANPTEACIACITHPDLPKNLLPANPAPVAISSQNAYVMTQAMRDVIQEGTAGAAKILNRTDLAGKTGTTNDEKDAWFSGFNSNVVTTVWVGYDNNDSTHEHGAQAALPIWIEFMGNMLKHAPESTMPMPPDIVTARIDPRTGLLAYPGQTNAISEVFQKQYQPTQVAAASPGYGSTASGGAASSGSSTTPGASSSADQPLF